MNKNLLEIGALIRLYWMWVLLGLIIVLVIGFALKSSFDGWSAARAYERQTRIAKQEAADALKKAADIAREKLVLEKELTELEAKRDGKETEVEKQRIEAINDRLDVDRARREHRTDNPDRSQLCSELSALGYPCE